ncbi:MAG: magnesium/cobalt transporter CorA [Ktedonobacterales bacterium]|nr:magnesium/cobalt transporter CorA [Ktedonobacterales bacterium]
MQQRLLVWQNGKLNKQVTLKTLGDVLRDPQAVIWLDIDGDITDCRDQLHSVFKLSSITLDTMQEDRERAKFTEGKSYFYLVMHGLTFDEATENGATIKLDIVFGQNFVITAHRETFPWLESLCDTVWKGKIAADVMGRGMSRLLHSILDNLVDSYFPVLDQIDGVIDDLEDATVNSVTDAVQGRIFQLKRTVGLMRRVISPQVEVANALIARTGDVIPVEVEPYFADMHDHLIRAFEVLDSYRDLMSGLLDVYLSTVSNRLNIVMKQLAVIATIFMPITFITGVFGQNFAFSPQVVHDNGYFFWVVLLGMGLLTAMQLYYFKRKGWI